MKHSSHAHGVLLVLLACLLWGTTGTAHSFAPPDMPAHWVGALRLAVAALVFVGVAVYSGAARPTPDRSKVGFLAGWGTTGRLVLCALCMAVNNLAFFTGLRLSSSVGLGTTVAIGSSAVFAGLLAAALNRQWPRALWWLGMVIGITGGVLMALASSSGAPASSDAQMFLGLALCLIAGMAYGSYAVLCQPLLARMKVAQLNAWVFGVAALLSMPVALWLGEGTLPSMGARGWTVVLYLGVIATALAYALFSLGLKSISAATGVALSKAEPVTAFVLAAVVLGEPVYTQSVLGLALVLLGLWIVTRAEMRGTSSH